MRIEKQLLSDTRPAVLTTEVRKAWGFDKDKALRDLAEQGGVSGGNSTAMESSGIIHNRPLIESEIEQLTSSLIEEFSVMETDCRGIVTELVEEF